MAVGDITSEATSVGAGQECLDGQVMSKICPKNYECVQIPGHILDTFWTLLNCLCPKCVHPNIPDRHQIVPEPGEGDGEPPNGSVENHELFAQVEARAERHGDHLGEAEPLGQSG